MLENHYLYSTFVDAYGREVLARYFFESDYVNIPNTEMKMEVDPNHWVTVENDNLSLYFHDDFLNIFVPADKFATNYLNFVIDSINSDYRPGTDDITDIVLSVAEELVEKEISLTFKGKVRLIWDLIRNKKIYISKY
jgi:hypothetical protein